MDKNDKNILGLILNIIAPGVGSMVNDRVAVGIIQVILGVIGIITSIILIGIPILIAVWLWAVIQSLVDLTSKK